MVREKPRRIRMIKVNFIFCGLWMAKLRKKLGESIVQRRKARKEFFGRSNTKTALVCMAQRHKSQRFFAVAKISLKPVTRPAIVFCKLLP